MGICRFLLSKKEEVSLFDNGLRIESNLKILCNEKWQYRYVVCQRRCLSEAPLIGIFKNGRARERNEHLELFYLQNYIGYEYGFKYKGSNKTLALLVQGQTLIFSFNNVESMVFWKEWLKDVCGRSAMFFVRVYSAPKDSSVIKFSSRNARIHITRYALVIVQEVPPKQRLYLNLEDLSDVECVQNKFAFRALTYPWNHPQTFIFTSDQIPELTAKLQCLLKSKQYFGQSVQVSRLSSLKNSSLGQTSTSHAHQFFTHSPGVYANDGQSPETPLFCSLYANENDEIHRSSSQESSEDGEGPPPLKKKSFEEGPYAIPVDLGGDPTMDFDGNIHSGPIRSRGGSHNHDEIDDFHFVEGMPAHFLNQQLSPAEQMNPLGMNTPPPGLVKPISSLDFLSAGSKLRKSLSKKLKRHLAGSYSKYDGDKSSTSYPKEAGSGSQRRIRPKKSVTPVKELMNSTKLLAQPIIEESLSSAAQSPSMIRPAKAKATRNESFDSSISSTVRIDSAVRKGRERLKMSRRSSTSASQRNSTVNSEKSSTNDLTVVEKEEENEGMEIGSREEEFQNGEEEGTVKGKQSASDSKSISHSISTLQTNSQKSAVGDDFDRSGSVATTVHNLETPLAISLDELLDPEFKIKAPSAISLKEKSPSLSSEKSSNGSQRSLSVCSELNSRVMFQRGGKNRASGRSNKITEVPLPPTLPPPPLPPRKISYQFSMPKQLTRPIIKTNDDYADIDDAIFDEWTTFGHHDSNQIYANQPAPSFARKENIDYVQICPIATSALKELSSARGTAFKRSNSLYDILAIQSKNASKKQQQQQSSEAEYYSSFDWSPMAMGPRAFTSSTSYLTHMLSQARENLQKGAGSRNVSSSNLPNLK